MIEGIISQVGVETETPFDSGEHQQDSAQFNEYVQHGSQPMNDPDGRSQILWARWVLHEDGSLTVTATLAGGGRYIQDTTRFASLAEASGKLGESFGDVVRRAREVGSQAGRWRP